MLKLIRRYLGIKLFLSYFLVILIGVIVLATAAELAIPNSFNRHLAVMSSMMSSMMGSSEDLAANLFNNYRNAVNESLLLAASAAFAVAVIVSILVSRQVVLPLNAMKAASQRIANGTYSERVRIRGNLEKDDLDELDQLALSFNRMAERLEKTETMRRQLIGDVTHELRTPLTTIQGYMEGLMDGILPADEATYQEVFNEADRLKRLVNDLQELSRIESGVYQLDIKPVNMVILTMLVTKRLAQQFEEKGVELLPSISQNLPDVAADEDRIVQVMINLVGNALQYTSAGGRVIISAALSGSELQISISDTGIGLNPEHLQEVFTRFYRVDKSRSRAGGGSGIGLTIARYIVEAHGGKIWASSQGLGHGSVFTFTLPVVRR